MSEPGRLLLWLAGAWLVLKVIQYLTAARVFLTSAISAVRAERCDDAAVPQGERQLLMIEDGTFERLDFEPLGFIAHTPLLTAYGEPEHVRIFADRPRQVAALVSRRLAPEFGTSVDYRLISPLSAGRMLVTDTSAVPEESRLPQLVASTSPGASPAELIALHRKRLEEIPGADHDSAQMSLGAVAEFIRDLNGAVRERLRADRWTAASTDPDIDRVTLRGAFGMVRQSLRAFGDRGKALARPDLPSAENERQRIEADFQAVRHIAQLPRPAPGTPWPIIMLSVMTALGSLAGMSALWNMRFAVLVLAVIVLHEAGHALMMRAVGYSAVHVFFVPFIGAFTIGRGTSRSVRARVAVLLAGPVPGLLIGLVLLQRYAERLEPLWLLGALAFLSINGFNLMPLTPLDGGRVFEALTPPESRARIALQVLSSFALLGIGWALKDPLVAGIGIVGLLSGRRLVMLLELRRAVAAKVPDRLDRSAIVRAALEFMLRPQFAMWAAPSRQSLARAVADQFAEPVANGRERLIGITAYALCLVLAVFAYLRWKAIAPF